MHVVVTPLFGLRCSYIKIASQNRSLLDDALRTVTVMEVLVTSAIVQGHFTECYSRLFVLFGCMPLLPQPECLAIHQESGNKACAIGGEPLTQPYIRVLTKSCRL